MLSASAGGHASLRQASGGRKSLLFVPPFANAEGGDASWCWTMFCSCSSLLAVQLGLHFRSHGQSSKRSITIRNDRPSLQTVSGHSSYWPISRRKLTIADSTFSICSIVIFCRFVKRRCPPSLFLSPFSCAFSPRKLWLFAQKLFVDTLFFQSYTYSNNIWFCFQL